MTTIQDQIYHCALQVYRRKEPSLGYSTNVSTLLLMTAAHESLQFQHRRQMGMSTNSSRGGFGLFQLQWNSLTTSLDAIARSAELREHCIEYLEPYGFDSKILVYNAKPTILGILQQPAGDPLGACFARVHYLLRPGKIPDTLEGMAKYAKRHYNTRLGKATAELYLEAYQTYVRSEANG